MKELQEKIEALRAKINELKAGERTLANAQKLRELRQELEAKQTELATKEAEQAEIDKAFEDADVDKAPDPQAADGPKEGESEPGKTAEEIHSDDVTREDIKPATPSPVAPGTPSNPETGSPDGGDGSKTADGAAAGGPVALAASGADRSPTAGTAAPAVQPMVLTASGAGAAAGITPGAPLDRDSLAQVLTAAGQAAGVVSPKTRVLGIERFGKDVDPVSSLHSSIDNTRLIAKARAEFLAGGADGNRPVALTAAGCFCGPDELIRQTGVVGRRGRPFARMFPTIPINGGFRAMPDLAFNVDTGLRSGVSQWTCADQALVDANDPTTWKPCAEIACFTEETYEPYAVEACVTVERFHRWAHPEQVDAWINLLGIEYDSLAETLLIDQVEAEAGTPLTVGATGGLMEDHSLVAKIIYALGSLSFAMGYQFREGSGVLDGYTLSVPVGMAEALYADEKMRGFPSGVNSAEGIVRMIEAGSGVRFVERLDESTSRKAAAAATVAALNAGGAIDAAGAGYGTATHTPLLPSTFRMYLIPLEGYVHGEGTIVGADWHVDDALLRQNRMRYFLENVEILANLSVRKPHIIDVPGVIMGSYTDLVAPPA